MQEVFNAVSTLFNNPINNMVLALAAPPVAGMIICGFIARSDRAAAKNAAGGTPQPR